MYRYTFYYYYVTVLYLSGHSINGHFSIRVRVRVWYYFIFRDRYMKSRPTGETERHPAIYHTLLQCVVKINYGNQSKPIKEV